MSLWILRDRVANRGWVVRELGAPLRNTLRRAPVIAALLSIVGCTHHPAGARWLLSYDGSYQRSVAQEGFYARTLMGPDGDRCNHGLFTGVLFLGLREAAGGRWFAGWMNSVRANDATLDDWFAYLDMLTAQPGPLSRLDADAARVGAERISVAVMIPAIARGRRDLPSGTASVQVATADDRRRVYAQYVDSLRLKFARRVYGHLRLDAVYWLDEAVWGGDEPLGASEAAHERGLGVLWIPYYGAGGATRWRELGFDAAWQQPNYFFDGRLPRTRLDSAVARARGAGMGLELELDRRVLTDTAAQRRLSESIAAIGASNTKDLAVYDGAGTLYEIFTSKQPALRRLGQDITTLLCRR